MILNIKRDQTLERHAVLTIIQAVRRAGYLPINVHDGEEFQHTTRDRLSMSEDEVLNAVFSVDESTVYFLKHSDRGVRKQWIFFVLGNADDGSEVAADWSADDPTFEGAIVKAAGMEN